MKQHIRNKGTRRAKKLLIKNKLIVSKKGWEISSKYLESVRTNSKSFTSHGKLQLANNNGIALCNSILLSHFLNRNSFDIINVANYEWKCGYRGGALSYFSLYGYQNRIYNIFYFGLDDESYVFEYFHKR